MQVRQMIDREIKRCPRCNGTAVVTQPPGWQQVYVRCTQCGNCERGAHETREAAIMAWNSCVNSTTALL